MNRLRTTSLLAATLALGAASTLIVQHVRAAGIPATETLTHTGFLESPDGTPVNAAQKISLHVYNVAEAGNPACEVVPGAPIPVVSGHFQLPLPPECTAAVAQNPELWIEVRVDGMPLGRTKLGAVPYAVEAGHADSATTAMTATSATVADDARGLHLSSDGNAQAFISTSNSSSNNFSYLFLDKERGTGAAPEAVVKGDEVYRIYGRAFNAGAVRNATVIESVVDGSPGAQFVPGALLFGTSDGTNGEALERMRISSAGNVAIGSADTSPRLHVRTTNPTSTEGVVVGAADRHYLQIAPSMCQGCTNGIVQAGDSSIVYSNGTKGTGSFTNAPWADGVGGLRMDSKGNVGIGTSSPAYPLDVNGTVRATSFIPPSDERLKANIRTIEHPLDDVQRLRGVRFNWTRDGNPSIGVVAQEVERVYPELVSTAPDGTKGVDYDKLIAVVIEASKELAAQNAALYHENDALRQRMDRLERHLYHIANE